MNKRNFMVIFFLCIISVSIWFLVKRFESHEPVVIRNQTIKFLNKPRTMDFRIEDLESGLLSTEEAEGYEIPKPQATV